jgi:hypothetical protein
VEVHLLTAAMTAADQMKLGVWPCLGQVPGGIGGPAEVKTAVYENPRYSRESVRVAKKLAIREPGGVAEVVSDDARESHAKRWIFKALGLAIAGFQ